MIAAINQETSIHEAQLSVEFVCSFIMSKIKCANIYIYFQASVSYDPDSPCV